MILEGSPAPRWSAPSWRFTAGAITSAGCGRTTSSPSFSFVASARLTCARRYNGLVCDYNKLLGEAKWLFGECTRISDEAGRRGQRIAELEQELAELRAAKAESDEKVMNYAAERANRVMSGLQ